VPSGPGRSSRLLDVGAGAHGTEEALVDDEGGAGDAAGGEAAQEQQAVRLLLRDEVGTPAASR